MMAAISVLKNNCFVTPESLRKICVEVEGLVDYLVNMKMAVKMKNGLVRKVPKKEKIVDWSNRELRVELKAYRKCLGG